MQGNHLFEYAVVRVVPKVEREEFLNVGVVLYCRDLKFLEVMFGLDETRLRVFSNSIDIEELKEYLQAFENICKGTITAGPIGQLDMASRFRWLTAFRSTVVQTSKVHPGFCRNPLETLARLHAQLVC